VGRRKARTGWRWFVPPFTKNVKGRARRFWGWAEGDPPWLPSPVPKGEGPGAPSPALGGLTETVATRLAGLYLSRGTRAGVESGEVGFGEKTLSFLIYFAGYQLECW